MERRWRGECTGVQPHAAGLPAQCLAWAAFAAVIAQLQWCNAGASRIAALRVPTSSSRSLSTLHLHSGMPSFASQKRPSLRSLSARHGLLLLTWAQAERSDEDEPEALAAVLRGRPVLTLLFNDLDMQVEQPQAFEPALAAGRTACQPAYA